MSLLGEIMQRQQDTFKNIRESKDRMTSYIEREKMKQIGKEFVSRGDLSYEGLVGFAKEKQLDPAQVTVMTELLKNIQGVRPDKGQVITEGMPAGTVGLGTPWGGIKSIHNLPTEKSGKIKLSRRNPDGTVDTKEAKSIEEAANDIKTGGWQPWSTTGTPKKTNAEIIEEEKAKIAAGVKADPNKENVEQRMRFQGRITSLHKAKKELKSTSVITPELAQQLGVFAELAGKKLDDKSVQELIDMWDQEIHEMLPYTSERFQTRYKQIAPTEKGTITKGGMTNQPHWKQFQ